MKRFFLPLLVSCLLLFAAWDLSRPASAQWSASAAIASIRLYRSTLAPLLARTGVRCHFTPSCSRYAEAVIRRHGLLGGGWRAAKRLARCGPWTPMGTVDEPQ